MNKEVVKAMNAKETWRKKLRKWWVRNDYKTLRVVFFPIWLVTILYEKINHWLDSRAKWDEKRANKILSYYIPRRAKWNKENKEFYLFDNGLGWNFGCAKRYLKRKDRRFWYNNSGFYGGRIRDYLVITFELEGFKKEVVSYYSDGETEIIFKLIKKE